MRSLIVCWVNGVQGVGRCRAQWTISVASESDIPARTALTASSHSPDRQPRARKPIRLASRSASSGTCLLTGPCSPGICTVRAPTAAALAANEIRASWTTSRSEPMWFRYSASIKRSLGSVSYVPLKTRNTGPSQQRYPGITPVGLLVVHGLEAEPVDRLCALEAGGACYEQQRPFGRDALAGHFVDGVAFGVDNFWFGDQLTVCVLPLEVVNNILPMFTFVLETGRHPVPANREHPG